MQAICPNATRLPKQEMQAAWPKQIFQTEYAKQQHGQTNIQNRAKLDSSASCANNSISKNKMQTKYKQQQHQQKENITYDKLSQQARGLFISHFIIFLFYCKLFRKKVKEKLALKVIERERERKEVT